MKITRELVVQQEEKVEPNNWTEELPTKSGYYIVKENYVPITDEEFIKTQRTISHLSMPYIIKVRLPEGKCLAKKTEVGHWVGLKKSIPPYHTSYLWVGKIL